PTCTAASYGSSYQTVEGSCDGLDNDCDGTTDTGAIAGNCPDKGVCFGGKKGCDGTCQVTGYQSVETLCDSKDNDCDGTTDTLPDGGPLRDAVSCNKPFGVC